jgi:hypothetical protein
MPAFGENAEWWTRRTAAALESPGEATSAEAEVIRRAVLFTGHSLTESDGPRHRPGLQGGRRMAGARRSGSAGQVDESRRPLLEIDTCALWL